MRECFVPKTFSAPHERIIAAAAAIIANYRRQGFSLTLRQLYYQFVATQPLAKPFPNTTQSYKRLGKIISDARLAGRLDWAAMEDRTRRVIIPNAWSSPDAIVGACARQYQIDLWRRQPAYVEAWIEKDALVGVLEAACEDVRLPFFSCRGYTSQSALYDAGKRIAREARNRDAVILHLGDHDPSGIDMTRDIAERVTMFAGRTVGVRRLALNMDQVEDQNPPPNPAKLTDSRAADYVARYGYDSWELDALTPTFIRGLIEDEVASIRDETVWEEDVEREREERAQIEVVAENWSEVVAFAEDL